MADIASGLCVTGRPSGGRRSLAVLGAELREVHVQFGGAHSRRHVARGPCALIVDFTRNPDTVHRYYVTNTDEYEDADMTIGRTARRGGFQDEKFFFDELAGLTLERLLVYVDEQSGEPSIVFLKPSDQLWQRFFLDAGLGFWCECSDEEINEEIEDSSVVDYGDRFGVIGQRLGHVRCDPTPRIRVGTSSGDIILEATDASILDSPTRLRFEPRSGAANVTIERDDEDAC